MKLRRTLALRHKDEERIQASGIVPMPTREDSTNTNPEKLKLHTFLIVFMPPILHALARVRLPGSTLTDTSRLISCELLVCAIEVPIAVPDRNTLAIVTPVSGHSGRVLEPSLTD